MIKHAAQQHLLVSFSNIFRKSWLKVSLQAYRLAAGLYSFLFPFELVEGLFSIVMGLLEEAATKVNDFYGQVVVESTDSKDLIPLWPW